MSIRAETTGRVWHKVKKGTYYLGIYLDIGDETIRVGEATLKQSGRGMSYWTVSVNKWVFTSFKDITFHEAKRQAVSAVNAYCKGKELYLLSACVNNAINPVEKAYYIKVAKKLGLEINVTPELESAHFLAIDIGKTKRRVNRLKARLMEKTLCAYYREKYSKELSARKVELEQLHKQLNALKVEAESKPSKTYKVTVLSNDRVVTVYDAIEAMSKEDAITKAAGSRHMLNCYTFKVEPVADTAHRKADPYPSLEDIESAKWAIRNAMDDADGDVLCETDRIITKLLAGCSPSVLEYVKQEMKKFLTDEEIEWIR